jgi:hypothetical protein
MDAWLVRASPAPKEDRDGGTGTGTGADPACVAQEYRFVREDMCAMGPGVVPSLLRALLGARKLARAEEDRDAFGLRAVSAELNASEVVARARADVEAARAAVDTAVAETRGEWAEAIPYLLDARPRIP